MITKHFLRVYDGPQAAGRIRGVWIVPEVGYYVRTIQRSPEVVELIKKLQIGGLAGIIGPDESSKAWTKVYGCWVVISKAAIVLDRDRDR